MAWDGNAPVLRQSFWKKRQGNPKHHLPQFWRAVSDSNIFLGGPDGWVFGECSGRMFIRYVSFGLITKVQISACWGTSTISVYL